MRILLLTGSPARYMAPPRLSVEQINAGPDWTDAHAPDGRVISLRTPVGEYDVATVLARLPADQYPDAIVALVDASWRNQPRGLSNFAGLKALLVADTHHMRSPLLGMLRYAAAEVYDRIVLLYDRHHAEIFRSAGLGNLFWLPGLTFPHDDASVRAARRAKREPQIAFVGQTGTMHARRSHLLEAMRLCRLPVVQKMVAQREALGFYGASLLGFNASLNGDLNLRALEILASGAALLTDRLSSASGLELLWRDGTDLLTYRNADELAERAEQALAHPRETAAIGAAGAAWFDRCYGELRRRELFTDVLVNGRAAPEFALPTPAETVFFPGNLDGLLQATMVYEGLQELHRQQETVRVALGEQVPADVGALCATLPRLESAPVAEMLNPDMTVFSRRAPDVATETPANRLWCCDAVAADYDVLAEALAPADYQLVSRDVAVLCRALPENLTSDAVATSSPAATA